MSFSLRRWLGCFGKIVALLILGAGALYAAAVYAPDKVRAALKDIGALGEFVSAALPPPLPDAKQPSKAYWLTQNWSARERFWFHHESQGTATFPIPYDWFVSLDQADLSIFSRPGLLADPDYLVRFGFIPSPRKLDGSVTDFGYRDGASTTQVTADPEQFKDYPENPDGLPVGFAKLEAGTDPATGEPYPAQIGFTCAACHTGHLRYKDVSLRFDGGPAMTNLGDLESAIGLSIFYTVYVPTRFNRFADRVVDRAAKAGSPLADPAAFKAKLKDELKQVLTRIKRERDWSNEILARANVKDIDEGFGRLDALNRIGNQVFFSDLLPPVPKNKDNEKQALPEQFARNYARPDAPVSFPPIWDAPWFLWAQYDASILNELVRNAGESLGVKTKLNLTVHSNPDRPLFRSSMKMMNIVWIEEMLRGPDPFADNPPGQGPHFKGLAAPRWDEAANIFKDDPAWKLDPVKVGNGRRLYSELCVECHRGPVRDAEFDRQWPDLSFWRSDNPDRADKNWVTIGDRSFFNVVQKPVAAMGTDPQQSRVLTERQVYLPPELGLNPIDLLNAKWNCGLPPNDEALNASFVLSLMAVVDKSIDQWFKDNPTPAELAKRMRGPRPNCQNKKVFKPIPAVDGKPADPPLVVAPHYRARPLDGVWATAPYLHNGSVPTLTDMLTPQHERPQIFCIGSREFDPAYVGLTVERPAKDKSFDKDIVCASGLTRFDVTGLGNSNLGHSFEGTEADKTKLPNGVIGRGLSGPEREALVEYLKTL
jgi:hypothetical protein